jgi:hypothetical protein
MKKSAMETQCDKKQAIFPVNKKSSWQGCLEYTLKTMKIAPPCPAGSFTGMAANIPGPPGRINTFLYHSL